MNLSYVIHFILAGKKDIIAVKYFSNLDIGHHSLPNQVVVTLWAYTYDKLATLIF